jgi:hypothetical protein
MKWKKGEATVLTTTLLIAISMIAGSFVLSMAQPQNYVPIADEPEILEKIDVVQVSQHSPTSILVGIFNTGGYDAVIDMIYVKDAQKNLVKAFQVGALVPVDEMANVLLPTSGQDTSNWINFEAVTERGNSDMLQIATPVDTLPGYVSNYLPELIGVFFNGVPVTSPSELAKLSEIDDVCLNATTQQKTYDNTTVSPLLNQSFQLNSDGKLVGLGGSEFHLIVTNNKACIVLGGLMPVDSLRGVITKFNLNIVGDFQPNKNITIEVQCFNFDTQIFDGPLPKRTWILDSSKPNINVTFGITNAFSYVEQNTGNFSVMVNITISDNTQNLKLDLAQIHITPEYFLNVDGLFVYEITEPVDISKIQSIGFSVTNKCNASSIPFLLKIFNVATNSWDIVGTYTSSNTPNSPTTFSKEIDYNIPSFIGIDRKLYINFVPAYFILEPLQVSFDQAVLEVKYCN